MKSISIILLLTFIAALLTVPGHEQFNKYLNKKGKNIGTCLGGTRHLSYKVFTLDYVDYCSSAPVKKGNPDNSAIAIQKKLKTDKYLGIFGMFWKL